MGIHEGALSRSGKECKPGVRDSDASRRLSFEHAIDGTGAPVEHATEFEQRLRVRYGPTSQVNPHKGTPGWCCHTVPLRSQSRPDCLLSGRDRRLLAMAWEHSLDSKSVDPKDHTRTLLAARRGQVNWQGHFTVVSPRRKVGRHMPNRDVASAFGAPSV